MPYMAFFQSAKAEEGNHCPEAIGLEAEAKSTAREAKMYLPHYQNNDSLRSLSLQVRRTCDRSKQYPWLPGLSVSSSKQNPTPYQQCPTRYKQYPTPYQQNPIRHKQYPTPYQQNPIQYDQIDTPYQQYPSRHKQNPIQNRQLNTPYKQYPTPYQKNPIRGGQLNTPYRQRPVRYQQIILICHHMTSPDLRMRQNTSLITSKILKTSDVSGETRDRTNQKSLFK